MLPRQQAPLFRLRDRAGEDLRRDVAVAQPLLGRNRCATRLAVERLALGREVARDRTHEAPNRPVPVIGRHPILEDHRRQHHPLHTLVPPQCSPPG